MVATIQSGTLSHQFNRVGAVNFSRTETETEDAGSPVSRYQQRHGEASVSKFATFTVAIVPPEKEPVIRAKKPLDVSARALKL
jgi:hypothetical protein